MLDVVLLALVDTCLTEMPFLGHLPRKMSMKLRYSALEHGFSAFLAVIGTQKLPFPDNAFDVVHCARCRVHWGANGVKPLLELNRVLRPGGFYISSATPAYR